MRSKFIFLTLTLTVILFLPNILPAQDQKLSVNVSYPIPIGDTFYSNYNGVVNTSFQYSRSIGSNFYVNGEFDYSNSELQLNNPFGENSITHLNIFKLIASVELPLKIENILTFRPELGVGFAHLRFNNNELNDQNTDNGFSGKFSLQVDRNISEKVSIGISGSYNLILLGEPDVGVDTPYNKELHSVNIGIVTMYHF
ncbi:MAG: hypothetical protein WD059_04370 [Balneolaceae bacterium]